VGGFRCTIEAVMQDQYKEQAKTFTKLEDFDIRDLLHILLLYFKAYIKIAKITISSHISS